MSTHKNFQLFVALILCLSICVAANLNHNSIDVISFTCPPKDVKLYWKDDSQKDLRSIGRLKNWLESKGKTLRFAMNAGMYQTDNSPLGLYIENGKTLSRTNTANASGNFYLKPNGVFFITSENKASILPTEKFGSVQKIKYATQSGPMLVVEGKVHPEFKKGSTNLQIRNGVGILPNGNVVFAMSKEKVNLYDFAMYFKNNGCKNALYLDGFVSRTYLPEKSWIQEDGNFGVIIGIIR